MHGHRGVDGQIIHAATKVGVRSMLLWEPGAKQSGALGWGNAWAVRPVSRRALFLFLPTTQMPFAGFYADGEIGPEVTNGRSALWWANAGSSGPGGAAGSSAAAAAAAAPAQPRGVLQGFTTVVTSLGAAPA